jgi:predicted RNA methylase
MDSKLQYLFGFGFRKWHCTSGNYYAYVTPHLIISKISDLADEHFHGLGDKVIWDMFAGIGTDGIRLAQRAGKVICTEINPTTYIDLQKNSVDIDNVESYNVDCCKFTTKCDIIYFDPPWGDTYRSGEPFNFNDIRLSTGTTVAELAKSAYNGIGMIIKSPITCNTFEELFADETIYTFTFTQQKLKFLFIIGGAPL